MMENKEETSGLGLAEVWNPELHLGFSWVAGVQA